MKNLIPTLMCAILLSANITAQNPKNDKSSIAIVSIDCLGLRLDNLSMANLVRLELEKTDRFEVLDKYDVSYILKQNNIPPEDCFGKRQLVKVGNILKVDKMLTGSAEKFGDKIIFILRLIDVKSEQIEKTSVKEFLLQEVEIQHMARIVVNDLLGIQNDPMVVDLLINYDRPITSEKTTMRLNGPRFGLNVVTGRMAERLMAPLSEGGFDTWAWSSVFGYQHEVQYMSSGDFQALFEFIFTINGLESGRLVPALVVMNGVRWSSTGIEFGIGPVFRINKLAKGYYDSNGKWVMSNNVPENSDYTLISNLDHRGDLTITTGLILAAGKTFRSGYLNIPVNLYWSPNPQLKTNIIGILVGFNIAKKPRVRTQEEVIY